MSRNCWDTDYIYEKNIHIKCFEGMFRVKAQHPLSAVLKLNRPEIGNCRTGFEKLKNKRAVNRPFIF